MNGKSKFSEEVMSFFVCTTMITLLEGVLGMIFFPDVQLRYDAFFSPPFFGALSVLFGVVTWSKKELSIKQLLIRRLIHLGLIEAMVFGLNYLAGVIFPLKVSITLALGIAVVFVVVYVVLWLIDRKSARDFNHKLKEYQETILLN